EFLRQFAKRAPLDRGQAGRLLRLNRSGWAKWHHIRSRCSLAARWPPKSIDLCQSIDLRQIAADAETAIAAETPIAIEYRKSRQFDRQPQFRMAIGAQRRGDRP